MEQWEVLPQNLQLCTDMEAGLSSVGKFQLGDLVQMETQTMGVLVRLEREKFHVLGTSGQIIECNPTTLQKRNQKANTIALDSEKNTIRCRDIVKVLEEASNKPRDGQIKYLFRNFAFLHSQMYTKNGGIFVIETRHVKLAGNSTNSSRRCIVDKLCSTEHIEFLHVCMNESRQMIVTAGNFKSFTGTIKSIKNGVAVLLLDTNGSLVHIYADHIHEFGPLRGKNPTQIQSASAASSTNKTSEIDSPESGSKNSTPAAKNHAHDLKKIKFLLTNSYNEANKREIISILQHNPSLKNSLITARKVGVKSNDFPKVFL